MSTVMLTRKCQATIPKDIRDHLHLHPGDRVEFRVNTKGKVEVQPVTTDITELDGLLKSKVRKPVTVEEMNQAIERCAGGTP